MNPLFRTGISLALTLGIVGGFIAQTVAQSNKIQGLVSDKAMVVSAREEASQIGIEIIRKTHPKNSSFSFSVWDVRRIN